MTEVMWDAADPGHIWGFLNWLTVVASGGTGRVARFGQRDATRKLVHATGFLQDAIVHFACRTEDHALRFCQTDTVRRTPRDIRSYGRVSPGGIF